MRRGLLLALVGVLVSGAFVLAAQTRQGPAAPVGEARPSAFAVVDLAPDDVHRIEISAGGSSVALVHATAGTWLAEPGTPAPSVALLTELEDEVFPLLAYRRLEVEPLAEFGLAPAELAVRVEGHTGDSMVVSVGGPTFSGGGFYARREGDAGVYLLARRSVDHLRSLVRGERVDTPRSLEETRAVQEAGRFEDPEEVTNPWLGQILDEVPE
jgi:hypothetical protein